MIQTLRQRNFALLWAAGFVTLLGTWAMFTVLPVYIYQETESAFLAGMVLAVITVPSIVIGPISGVFVDRWNRQRVMLAVNLLQAALLLSFALAAQTGSVVAPYVFVLIQAALVTFYSPAETALLPSVVPEEFLVSANALNGLNDNLARIIGPAAGAVLFAQFGLSANALFNAAGFALAAGLVWLVRITPPVPAAAPADETATPAVRGGAGVWRELVAGVRIVWEHPLLRSVFLVLGCLVLADTPLTSMLAPFVEGSLRAGPEAFGTLLSLRGVAGLLGGVLVAQVGLSIREDRLIGLGCLAIGIGVYTIAVTANFLVACIVMLVLGPAFAAAQTGVVTLLQRGTEDQWRGRVFSLLGTVTGVIGLAGTLIGSTLGELWSPPQVIALSGVLFAVTCVAALLLLAAGVAALPRPARAS